MTAGERRVREAAQTLGFLAALIVSAPGAVWSQSGPGCAEREIRGRVQHGQSFEASVGQGLVFRLTPERNPTNPQGWTIEVVHVSQPDQDLVYAATPPYRFSNPRYLDTAYGVSASGALQWSPRAFRYFTTVSDNRRALDALSVLLWSGRYSEAERDAAAADLEALDPAEGELWIEDGSTAASPVEGSREIIEWLRFRVRLCGAAD